MVFRLPLWKIMEWVKVSWDDEIPWNSQLNGKIGNPNVPNHQPVIQWFRVLAPSEHNPKLIMPNTSSSIKIDEDSKLVIEWTLPGEQGWLLITTWHYWIPKEKRRSFPTMDHVWFLTDWWFQSLWKILVSWDDYSKYMEKKICSKPPISPPVDHVWFLPSGKRFHSYWKWP